MSEDKLTQWEDRRREYLGGAITLFLGLSSASIAFCGGLLTQDSVKLGGWRTFFFIAAVFFFVLALLASLIVTFTRLQDARATVDIVRKQAKGGAAFYLANLRSNAHRLGALTWRLLYIQAATFFTGAILLLVALSLIFHAKLFPSQTTSPRECLKTGLCLRASAG